MPSIETISVCAKAIKDHGLFPIALGLILLAILLLVGCYAYPKGTRRSDLMLAIIVTACGVGLGMLAASFASPRESTEADTFKTVTGIMASFLTGFLLKNFETQLTKVQLSTLVNSARFWMFAAAFIGGGVTTYVYRVYYSDEEKTVAMVERASRDLGRIIGELPTLPLMISEQDKQAKIGRVTNDLKQVLGQLSELQPKREPLDVIKSCPPVSLHDR